MFVLNVILIERLVFQAARISLLVNTGVALVVDSLGTLYLASVLSFLCFIFWNQKKNKGNYRLLAFQ